MITQPTRSCELKITHATPLNTMETNEENGSYICPTKERKGKCMMCHSEASKYTCPRCRLMTCCLSCVKNHKAQSGCSGIRDKTAYVAVKEFTESHLLSDYRFLEEADRMSYSASTDEKSKPGYLNFRWKLVSKEAYKRSIKLKLLPHHFSKHRENSTSFHKKTKLMMWHVKWVFPQSAAEYTDIRLRETITLREALGKYINPKTADPAIRQRLKCYCTQGMDAIRVFMKVENQPANVVRYHSLDLDKTLRDSLVGKCLVEYPTFHLVLPEHAAKYTLPNQDALSTPVEDEKNDGVCVGDKEAEKETKEEMEQPEDIVKPPEVESGR